MIDEIPRRNRMDQWTAAERAIFDAVQAVESAGADVRLTDAVILLQAARDSVADFVDGINNRRTLTVWNELAPWVPTAISSDRTLDTVTADEWRKADANERRAFHAYWRRLGHGAFMCLTCTFPTARGQASCEACR